MYDQGMKTLIDSIKDVITLDVDDAYSFAGVGAAI